MHVVVLQKPLFKLICLFTTFFTSIIVTMSAIVMVRDTENLPFSADTPRRFSEGSRAAIRRCLCGNARIVSAAMRKSSAQQCADAPWIYTMRK